MLRHLYYQKRGEKRPTKFASNYLQYSCHWITNMSMVTSLPICLLRHQLISTKHCWNLERTHSTVELEPAISWNTYDPMKDVCKRWRYLVGVDSVSCGQAQQERLLANFSNNSVSLAYMKYLRPAATRHHCSIWSGKDTGCVDFVVPVEVFHISWTFLAILGKRFGDVGLNDIPIWSLWTKFFLMKLQPDLTLSQHCHGAERNAWDIERGLTEWR